MAWYNFSERLDRAERQIAALIDEQEGIMTTIAELTQAVTALVGEVDKIGPAIDDLEAKVTAALANTKLSAADQQAIDDAFAALQASKDKLASAASDAADGVDEAGKV